ncbi:hypothetical protein ACJJTC_006263 [Scirpophaga incertulas]
MSVPPLNYSIPPPQFTIPPVGATAVRQGSPVVPATMPPLGSLPAMTNIPPPNMYSYPPPTAPMWKSDSDFSLMNLPPMHIPPPSVANSRPITAQVAQPTTRLHHSPRPARSVQSNFYKRDIKPTVECYPNVRNFVKIERTQSPSSMASYDSQNRYDKNYEDSYKSSSVSSSHNDRNSIERDRRIRERESRYYDDSRSTSTQHRVRSRSPPRYYKEDRHSKERYYDRYDYERKRHESDHRHSPHRARSSSRKMYRSRSRESYRSHSREPYRSHSRESHRSHSRETHRSHSRETHRSHSRDSYRSNSRDDRRNYRSPSRYSSQRDSHSCSRPRDTSPPNRVPQKPLTDREKILEEYRKNFCKTADELIEKMEQWSREHNFDEDEGSKMWYRSSPAELYYKPIEKNILMQTKKLEKLCETFFKSLIERGRSARPEVDELPPLKLPKAKMCSHKSDEKGSSATLSPPTSSDDDEVCLDDDGLQGYSDRIMLELQRKQSHPRRLHPEMWFNDSGQMNGGPLCRCSARARRQGMRHGVFAGEETFPKCIPNMNNIDKLYHYRITVSPPTNFLIKAPTIIGHDEHEFLFSGFSMFSHYKLAELPTCKVIRFNIEYTILYVEEPAPPNFTVQELDLFEEFLFIELLELVDLDLGKATETTCSQFHFMPRFVRLLPEGGCEVLSMCEVLKYLLNESGLLIPRDKLEEVHNMDHYDWQKFVDRLKGMIVTYPGKKPCSVRLDQLDRSPPNDQKNSMELTTYYPEIVHFGIRPPQLSYAGNPDYQKAWRYYVKYRHLVANMPKPSANERQKLSAKEAKLQEMRTQSKMKRDVTVAISSEGFHTTGLMCDVVQHAMLIPILVKHLRFHKSLDRLERNIGYVFKQRVLLQTALTHPSYRENFGTNPDHARNSLTNCGIRQPEYGDRRIHYTRKKGIVTLINIMSRFGKNNETESEIKHNERLEFLGDAVVEFVSSIHLFRMFPCLAEGGLATFRAAIVQNQHLAHLAKNIELEKYMLYAHGSDLCREIVMRHAMANCFEALMAALFLDSGLQVAHHVFALALWHNEPELLEVWNRERAHPLQEQEPLGDRKYIKNFEFLQKLTKFEDAIGVKFKHIRLLARAFTDRSVGFTHLTLGSNQRLEFLGDTVLQLVVSDKLYKHFPDHHEGHLSLLRSSLVNNRTQSLVCDDLDMSTYAIYNNPKAKPTTKKHKADLLEAFLGALYIDKGMEYCEVFCDACIFPRLQEFILNQDWNDPKSKLQQCCLTLRSMEGGEPDIPIYKVIECLGPTNTRVYTVGVYFRGRRLAAARGHSIQEAEMHAAETALATAHGECCGTVGHSIQEAEMHAAETALATAHGECCGTVGHSIQEAEMHAAETALATAHGECCGTVGHSIQEAEMHAAETALATAHGECCGTVGHSIQEAEMHAAETALATAHGECCGTVGHSIQEAEMHAAETALATAHGECCGTVGHSIQEAEMHAAETALATAHGECCGTVGHSIQEAEMHAAETALATAHGECCGTVGHSIQEAEMHAAETALATAHGECCGTVGHSIQEAEMHAAETALATAHGECCGTVGHSIQEAEMHAAETALATAHGECCGTVGHSIQEAEMHAAETALATAHGECCGTVGHSIQEAEMHAAETALATAHGECCGTVGHSIQEAEMHAAETALATAHGECCGTVGHSIQEAEMHAAETALATAHGECCGTVGHSIQEAEMHAAETALATAHGECCGTVGHFIQEAEMHAAETALATAHGECCGTVGHSIQEAEMHAAETALATAHGECCGTVGHSIQEAEMHAAETALATAHGECCATVGHSIQEAEMHAAETALATAHGECCGTVGHSIQEAEMHAAETALATAHGECCGTVGHSIQEAEMHSAETALATAHELFPQLDHQKRVIANSMKKKKKGRTGGSRVKQRLFNSRELDERVPKAYRGGYRSDSSDDNIVKPPSEDEADKDIPSDKSEEDSGLDSDSESLPSEKLNNVKVSSLLTDMQKLKDELIRRNEYEKLKEKCRRSGSDDD